MFLITRLVVFFPSLTITITGFCNVNTTDYVHTGERFIFLNENVFRW